MNLSSYLQMPPTPLATNSPPLAVPQGPRAGAGPSAGASLGFDFGQVMARQMERLVPQERQNFAAETPQTPDSDQRQPTHTTERAENDTRETRTEKDDLTDEATQEEASTHLRPRNKAAAAKKPRAEVDALLEDLMQGAPAPLVAPSTPPVAAASLPTSIVAVAVDATPLTAVGEKAASTPDTPTDVSASLPLLPTATPLTSEVAASGPSLAPTPAPALAPTPAPALAPTLQTVELSPQMRIITDPQQAPSPESLAAFAKSMGLDESTIQNLLAQQPATPATAIGSANNAAQGLTMALSVASSPTVSELTAPMNLTSASPVLGTPVTTDSAVATQLAAMNASVDTPLPVASGTGLAAPASTLAAPTMPGMTPTDMAAIQQMQITVLPAAVLPVNTNIANTPVPSTLDMLSLLGTGVDEQDVSALLSRFSEDAGHESNADQQPSQDEGQNFSGFAQTLARNSATAATQATQVAATNMAEVYDQLSDKMATEMAARMHKQLSDGEWKMKFALRPSNLGGVEIQLEMKDGKLDAVFRADNPLTRDLLQNSSQRLRDALGNFGINAGQVNVGQGGANSQQNNSGNAGKRSQVSDNSSSQVNGTGSASSPSSTRNKANASLLDLYA